MYYKNNYFLQITNENTYLVEIKKIKYYLIINLKIFIINTFY